MDHCYLDPGIASGIIGFIINEDLIRFSRMGILVSKPVPAFVIALTGWMVCAFCWLVITDYGQHTRRNWNRANVLKDKIRPLEHILKGDESEEKGEDRETDGLPKICRRLITIVFGFFIIFSLIAILSIINML